MCYKSLVKGALLGGIIVFLWSCVSWMALPWHQTTMHTFQNGDEVAQVLVKNAPASGIYVLPGCNGTQPDEAIKKSSEGPVAFVSLRSGPKPFDMGQMMFQQLLISILGALCLTWLLMQTRGLTYRQRVQFFVVTALAAGILCHLPNWHWWEFSSEYTLVAMADLIIGWLLAGLILAKFVYHHDPKDSEPLPAEPSEKTES